MKKITDLLGRVLVSSLLAISPLPFNAVAEKLPGEKLPGEELLIESPIALTNDNLQVGFEVDSTWTLVKGDVKDLKGTLTFSDRSDPLSVSGEMNFAVSSFDTQNSRRDKHLREVMAADQFPSVSYRLTKVIGCSVADLQSHDFCEARGFGDLTIRDVTKAIPLQLRINRQAKSLQVSATAELLWRDFGVEDPSILVAYLKEKVLIKIEITLPIIP